METPIETTTETAETAAPAVRPETQTEVAQAGAFASVEGFESAQRMALAISKSSLLPKIYQGDVSNCLIGLEMSNRMNMNPMQVMQELHIIHGKPTFSAKFLIACVNGSGKFSPLRFRYNDARTACRAYAEDLITGENCEGPAVTMSMAQAEGWVSKAGSKWKTMPELMLSYRAATFFARLYCPEMALGIMTRDEMEDIHGNGTSTRRRREKVIRFDEVTENAAAEKLGDNQ